jgi:hypothetical protein
MAGEISGEGWAVDASAGRLMRKITCLLRATQHDFLI